MGLIMTEDGHVRPLRVSDLREVAERDERIRQLEELNRVLSEEIDRISPVLNAAILYRHGEISEGSLLAIVATYESSKVK